MRIVNLEMPKQGAKIHGLTISLPPGVEPGDRVNLLIVLPHGPALGQISFEVEDDDA